MRRVWSFAVVLLLSNAWLKAANPNFIIIYADDLGWGDLGCYGGGGIATPHLDQLARQGVRFTNFYSPSPVCSPSRASLLTGRYPFRTGVDAVLKPSDGGGLPSDETTLAELFSRQGYATGAIGKWHLGSRGPYLPLHHGFDEFFGMPYSSNMLPLRFIRDNSVLRGDVPALPLLTRRFTRAAVDFIERHRESPFFLYVAYSAPHLPLAVTEPWRGNSGAGVYGDVVQELDWGVGQIVEALRRYGLERKTALFFSSDNGSWRPASNGGLRGGKLTVWEGGIRVPLVASFPGVFPAGQVSRLPAMVFDLFATCLRLAEIELPPDTVLDSRHLLGELTGRAEPGTQSRQPGEPLFFFSRLGWLSAVRRGPWKLHVARSHGSWKNHRIRPQLYDLDRDPHENRNLAQQQPSLVSQLLEEIQRFQSRLGRGLGSVKPERLRPRPPDLAGRSDP